VVEPFIAPLWRIPVYAQLLEEVDPALHLDRFRPRDVAYQGKSSFWRTPSPEPTLPASVISQLSMPLRHDSPIIAAAANLAGQIAAYAAPDQILFVAILRAGVPLADWLTRMLHGSKAVATSLFVGHGIDAVALEMIRSDFPNRKLVFVDGWTGKGGVADELAKLNQGPLAVLCDPWGVADFRGTFEDILSPSACFTGPTTLGFSRTFTRGVDQTFAAYKFPPSLLYESIVSVWQQSCPIQTRPQTPVNRQLTNRIQTTLRLHSNEVCRALINANPQQLLFADSDLIAQQKYSLLIELANKQGVPQKYNATELHSLYAHVACSLRIAT
jgi:hypothetical protein